MKMLKRLMALMLALMMLCLGAAAQTSSEDVLVTVNGTPITRAAFENYYSNVSSYYAYYGYDVTTAENVAYLKYMSLDTLIQLALMDQKLVELGITLTEAEQAAAEQEGRDLWSEDVSSAMSYYGVTSASTEAERALVMVQVLAELEALGYTEESYVQEAVENALYLKLEAEMVRGAAVTDAQVQTLYAQLVNEDKDAYGDDASIYEATLQMNEIAEMYGLMEYYDELWYIPQGYRNVIHILLDVELDLLEEWYNLLATYEEQQGALEEGGQIVGEAVTAEEVENARLAILAYVQPTVDEINARLAEGATFQSLIAEYTIDSAMYTYDDITAGVQVHMDSILFPGNYRDAAFSVSNPGEVSEPVATEMGVYIVCYVSDAPGGAVQLTEARYQALQEDLMLEAENAKYTETMNSWYNAAEILFSDEAQAIMDMK